MNIPMTDLNSITNFNKVFDSNLKQFDQNLEQGENGFEGILNQSMAMNNKPQVISGNIELNVGLENMGITPYHAVDPSSSVKSGSAVEKVASDMGKAFGNGLDSVNSSQMDMERAVETMAAGGDISAHEVMIATEKANLSMQMAIQMRNKILAAYSEINNIRI